MVVDRATSLPPLENVLDDGRVHDRILTTTCGESCMAFNLGTFIPRAAGQNNGHAFGAEREETHDTHSNSVIISGGRQNTITRADVVLGRRMPWTTAIESAVRRNLMNTNCTSHSEYSRRVACSRIGCKHSDRKLVNDTRYTLRHVPAVTPEPEAS